MRAVTRFITLIRDGFATTPGLDAAVAKAMLLGASRGSLTESFRLYTPARIVAFGKRDTLEDGYPAAVAATRACGYLPIERLAGGRAAVFHEGTLAFNWVIPSDDPRSGVSVRFAALSELMVRAFRRLGIAAHVGEVEGEYCPGRWSVNIAGRVKVMGVGQRLERRAAHIGGVVVVKGAAMINEVLEPVYRALGLEWRLAATGALEDSVPGISLSDTADAIVAELGATATIVEAGLDATTIDLARQHIDDHVPDTL